MTTYRSEGARNVIRVNATSIDVTSSNRIAFGYANELAKAGRIIAGRHRLKTPLPDPIASGPFSTSAASSRVAPSAVNAKAAPRSNGVKHGGPVSLASHPSSTSAGVITGNVWSAESLWLGSTVLVELLDPAIAEDPSLADTFEWEARTAAAVQSPFVNRVLDFGIDSGTPYLVTEMPYGETLAERIRSGRAPTARQLEGILREVSLALDSMHALGLIHRELRSERLFLYRPFTRSDGRDPRPVERDVTTLSFGISKLMNDTLELVRTMARRAVKPADTPRYSSPEQVLGTSPLGPKSDLWSLAIIAFECLTGQMPFTGATMGERLVQICTADPLVPSDLSEVPHGFDEWFSRGVQKDPEKRFNTAQEMADAFSTLLG